MKICVLSLVLTLTITSSPERVGATNKVQEAAKERSIKMSEQEKGPDGLPIIFWSIKEENQEKVIALLNGGADIDSHGYHGATPVLAAAILENWEMVALLLDRGANAKAVDRRGFSLAWLASHSKVDSKSKTFEALTKVRKILDRLSGNKVIYDPMTIRQMLENGTWPPKDL